MQKKNKQLNQETNNSNNKWLNSVNFHNKIR